MLLLPAVLQSWPKKTKMSFDQRNIFQKATNSNSHRCEVATAHPPIVSGKVREPHSNDLSGGSPEGLFGGIDMNRYSRVCFRLGQGSFNIVLGLFLVWGLFRV